MQLSEKREVSSQGVSLSRGRALVIDQNHNDLQGYAGVLRHLGFEVKPFARYQDACRCLEEEAPDFVLVSQESREFESREVIKRAIAHNRHTPVVVLTQCVDMSCYLEAMQLGAVDYVEKPLAPAQMERLVTTHAQTRGLAMHQTA